MVFVVDDAVPAPGQTVRVTMEDTAFGGVAVFGRTRNAQALSNLVNEASGMAVMC